MCELSNVITSYAYVKPSIVFSEVNFTFYPLTQLAPSEQQPQQRPSTKQVSVVLSFNLVAGSIIIELLKKVAAILAIISWFVCCGESSALTACCSVLRL